MNPVRVRDGRLSAPDEPGAPPRWEPRRTVCPARAGRARLRVVTPVGEATHMTEQPRQQPLLRASDADREAVVGTLERALAEGRIDVDEFRQRVEAAYAAATTAQLDPLVADLPRQTEIVGTRAPATLFEVFGDIRCGGGTPIPRRAGSVFGDVRIDLRGLRTDAGRIELDLWTVFGDVEVTVAEGVDAGLEGWTVFGDRKTDLAAVPRLAATPFVAVRGRSVFGALRLRSLAPGEFAGRWRALLDRLAERRSGTLPPTA